MNFPITLEGKIVELEVEVVDANLNYNLLLGRSWTHAMFFVVSYLFRIQRFPHEGKIITIDQLSFFSFGSSNGNVPYVGNTEIPYESVGIDLFKDSALMVTFTLPPPHVHSVNMISDSTDPWIIPSEDKIDSFGVAMPLSPLEINYQDIVLASMAASESYTIFSVNLNTYVPSPWLGSWDSLDPLNETFPTDESIMEVMSLELRPVHPRKAVAIKVEVEKILKEGFIYPIPFTDWISNIILVAKNQGTIRVCVDYRDINRARPKDNYATPFIDQFIDECTGSEIFSFMDGFYGYNQINISHVDQHKIAFIYTWGTFSYKKLPLF
eukprot:PITA_21097